ncbi:HAD hydrolase-like protein [Spirosoma linguale]|uniref:HAD-superfamily hydrolase, subfamily IA, variant 1 n=1 Tax=Spirosoma linguale (strain ATCC 33905 / DSM 74 / LMG 10896 / Claus 1) TaxID=504472 RepID=D2QHJ1_SPILD|nr:HAD-superfamily hydrolase, subfamily IA, variant 1 [Spirosoma linguale DSM 74]
MNYKLVIFDFDGTLADSFPYFLRTINTLAIHYNFKQVELQHIDQLRALDARQMMKLAKLPAWKIPFIARSFIRLMARDIDQIQLFAGVPALLNQLTNEGVQLAIVSSNSEANIRRVLGPDNAILIQHYACGTALFGKQRKFKKVMSKYRVKPSETLCIGDEIRDIDAARKVNAAIGAVSWGYTHVSALKIYSDVILFDSLNDILATVLGDHLQNKP